jgi:hypothetical protein|tara:strand:- start:789 stop:986 length:198 start_codon:yes stop_codon:yes gene_type:complete
MILSINENSTTSAPSLLWQGRPISADESYYPPWRLYNPLSVTTLFSDNAFFVTFCNQSHGIVFKE